MKPHTPIGALFLATLLVSACATSSHQQPPQPKVASTYGAADSELNRPTVSAVVPAHTGTQSTKRGGAGGETRGGGGIWWRQFGDERLDRLVTRVLGKNTDLATAGLRLQQARLQAGLATSDLLPNFDVSASTGYSKLLNADSKGHSSYSLSASLSYELDLFGRLRTQRTIAQWEAHATEEDLQTTFISLVSDTCDLYWNLAFLNQRIIAGEESLARVQRTLTLVQTQFNAGAVSRLELREAEQTLRSQQASQSELIQQRIETRNALTTLLDGEPWPIADEPQDMKKARSPTIQPGIPAELLSRRPDLRAAELRLRESLAQTKLVRVSYYPAISLTGSVGGSSTSLSSVLANPAASLGAGLALPFIHWNEARLNTKIASAESKIAINNFRQSLYNAFTEVDNALSARQELTKQVELSQQSYDAALEVERLYDIRYRAGATPLRTWLDAQETRRQAELSLAQTRLTQLQNDSRLFQALGGGS